MNTTTTNIKMAVTAASIALLAGTALPVSFAAAQNSHRDPTKQTDRHSDQYQTRTNDKNNARPNSVRSAQQSQQQLGFYKTSALLGTDVANANGETVGSVENMVIDRGSGQVGYIILSSGGFLGLGDKQVAVPYDSFGFDRAEGRYRLDVTPEMIESSPDFDRDRFLTLKSDSWNNELDEAYHDARNKLDADKHDPFARSLKDAEKVSIEGTVVQVDRENTAIGDEQVSVQVRTEDGNTRTVVLGPSWYVMSQAAAPMRGDEISVQGYALQRDGKQRVIAREATIDDEDITLRNGDGIARWSAGQGENANQNQRSAQRSNQQARSPMLLLSDLVGMSADARDEEGGEIVNAIIEVESGHIALLTLDPNEGFLGLGDTLHLVPWQIAAVGTDTVRIDTDKDMLLNGVEMPDDVSTLASRSRLQPIYRAFRIEPAQFSPRERSDWSARNDLRGWAADSEFAKAIKGGEEMTISGTIRGLTTIAPTGDRSAATAVNIETDSGIKTVVLGPTWFIENQNLDLQRGNEITLDVTRAQVHGTEFIVARELDAGGRKVSLWTNGTPMWDAS